MHAGFGLQCVVFQGVNNTYVGGSAIRHRKVRSSRKERQMFLDLMSQITPAAHSCAGTFPAVFSAIANSGTSSIQSEPNLHLRARTTFSINVALTICIRYALAGRIHDESDDLFLVSYIASPFTLLPMSGIQTTLYLIIIPNFQISKEGIRSVVSSSVSL